MPQLAATTCLAVLSRALRPEVSICSPRLGPVPPFAAPARLGAPWDHGLGAWAEMAGRDAVRAPSSQISVTQRTPAPPWRDRCHAAEAAHAQNRFSRRERALRAAPTSQRPFGEAPLPRLSEEGCRALATSRRAPPPFTGAPGPAASPGPAERREQGGCPAHCLAAGLARVPVPSTAALRPQVVSCVSTCKRRGGTCVECQHFSIFTSDDY